MAVIEPGDTWEVKVGCYCKGQAGINILHYDVQSVDGTPQTPEALALAADTIFAPLYKALLANDASYYGVAVKRVRPLTPTAIVVSASLIGPGGAMNGGALPTQVSGIITKQGELEGRANRGRVYVPFPGDTFMDPTTSSPTAGYQTALIALKDTLIGDLNVGTLPNQTVLQPVIYDRLTGARRSIVSGRANQKWATQRRRGNYGAANPYPPF